MRQLATLAAVAFLAVRSVGAHAPDEYVQALKVAVSPERIVLQIGLTPGTEVAPEVIPTIDSDGDGRISPLEAERYGRLVLGSVSVSVDGSTPAVTLTRVDAPTVGALAAGNGTIHVEGALDVVGAPGRHELVVRNAHAPERSVYLANALLPERADVRIVRQRRDPRQQVFHLDYEVESVAASNLMWGLCGAAVLLAPLGWRVRRLERLATGRLTAAHAGSASSSS